MTPAPSAPVPRSGAAVLVVIGAVALLGNGLKALVTSTVLVSEGAFAAYLRMSPEQVAVLMQMLIAGMVVSLALCPLLLQRTSARRLGLGACAVATAAFGGFAAIDLAGMSPVWRLAGAFVGLAVGAGALALLAPVAQALVAQTPTPPLRTSLTTLWTLAAPAGFLLAPQLVKEVLPVTGLGLYFGGFALLPLAMALLLACVPLVLARTHEGTTEAAGLPAAPVLAFVAVVVAFETWTGVGDVAGFASPLALGTLCACLAAAVLFARRLRATDRPPALAGAVPWLLAALFLLQVPTTGFFDTAYLVASGRAEAFVANRATFGAAAQIAGTLAAGALAHRLPREAGAVRLAFAAIAAGGTALFLGYPSTTSMALLYAAPMVMGFGAAGLAVLLCLALVQEAGRQPILAAFPSMAIMLGTEFGLELLQMVYAAIAALGTADTVRYTGVFAAQVAFALAVPALLAAASHRADPSPVRG